MFQSIPNSSQISLIEYCPEFSAVCSIGKAPFHGTIEIQFKPVDLLLEYESFEAWLYSLANEKMTIEELCRVTFDSLTVILGNIPMIVAVRARTTVHAPACAIIYRDWS
jgi:NADPH-dependent 7-cyano-7-deazaguanine reductase QueF